MYGDMKRILLIVAVSGAGLLAVLAVILFLLRPAPTPHAWTLGAIKVLPAAHAYAKLLKAEGVPIPTFVSVQALVARGLLAQDDLKSFAGMEVSVSTSAVDDGSREVLIRARQPDGTDVVLLADGSVNEKGRGGGQP